MNQTKVYNDYPTVFIHGFLGCGMDNGFSKIFNYFGSFTKNLELEMGKYGYEVYVPSLGPFNGLWTRVCELWTYLVGGTVDYGKVHSEKFHTERYGRTYPGVLKDLGQPGKHAKVNLVGHSFGGPTVCLFASMLESGWEEERAGTPEEELSPLFQGGHGSWLHTATTISGTNNGTSACDAIGRPLRTVASAAIYGLGVLYGDTDLVKFYDFQNEHYHLMTAPGRHSHHFTSPLDKKAEIKNLIESDEDIMWNMTVEFSKDLAKSYVMIPTAYYFNRRGRKTHHWRTMEIPDKGINPIFLATAPIISLYRNKRLGIDKSYAASDGVVPTVCQGHPEGSPFKEWKEGEEFVPGIWQEMPVEPKDHEAFAGMFYPAGPFYRYYRTMLQGFRELPDGKA